MEKVCQMDCHSCNLQEGDLDKAICAAKFAPAMFRKIFTLMSNLAAHVDCAPSINEVLPFGTNEKEVKSLKKTKDENVEE